jgi:H+/gluconate symporter-like permease
MLSNELSKFNLRELGMSLRKYAVAFAVAALLVVSVGQPKAGASPVADPVVAAGTSAGAGIYFAGGIIAVAGILCVYDLYLKINGLKNWDGTAKRKR